MEHYTVHGWELYAIRKGKGKQGKGKAWTKGKEHMFPLGKPTVMTKAKAQTKAGAQAKANKRQKQRPKAKTNARRAAKCTSGHRTNGSQQRPPRHLGTSGHQGSCPG